MARIVTKPITTSRTGVILSAVISAAPLLSAHAQSPNLPNGSFVGVVGSMPYRSQELQFCQTSISNVATAIGCSGTLPANSTVVYFQPETSAIRCRGDGSAPTASVGQPVAVGQQMTYAAQPLSNLQCIAQSGTATVDEWFFR